MTGFEKKVLVGVGLRRNFIKWLREQSKPWPHIFIKHGGDFEIFLSTLVRIQRDGKWYLVHLVKSAKVEGSNAEFLFEQIIMEAHFIQNFYRIAPEMRDAYGDGLIPQILDPDQRSEKERLREVYPWLPKPRNL